MAGGEGGSAGAGISEARSLQETPTWAVATVCFVFIAFSIFIEHLIHLLCHWLKKRRKTALFEAVEKLKSVLILLGFMSLTMAVAQRGIAKICIPTKVANTMLPCRRMIITKTTKHFGTGPTWVEPAGSGRFERRLAGGAGASYCTDKGMSPLMSPEGMNQLSIFIFVLAVMQIVYSVATMGLGRAKMRRWKGWEKESQTIEYQAANDPNRFRFTRQTTFVNRHGGPCTETFIQLWIKCFFRQFFHSVKKVDYLTLRHGFIAEHISSNKSFNFQKYIQRSLEDDFKLVVGINPYMWLLVVIFLLADVHGWEAYLWVSFIPMAIVLVLGTKLEVIVARMALQLRDQNTVIKGAPVVQPNDNLFWFSHPNYVLKLLHFTLFMNAFEVAFFIWVTLLYGIHSCYHDHLEVIIIRVVLAISVQVMTSYITLPLYALVTQMGSHYKAAVLEQHTAKAMKQWHAGVRQKRKKQSLESSSHYTQESSSSHYTAAREESSTSHHSYRIADKDDNINIIVDEEEENSSNHRRNPTFGDNIVSHDDIAAVVVSQETTVLEIMHIEFPDQRS